MLVSSLPSHRHAEWHNRTNIHTLAFHGVTKRYLVKIKTATAQGHYSTSLSHTLNIALLRLVERVWCPKFQFSLLLIYFHQHGFQSSLLLIYFCDGPNMCSHSIKVWHKTYPICTVYSRDQHCAALLHHRNRATTTVLVSEHKLFPLWFLWQRKAICFSVNIT